MSDPYSDLLFPPLPLDEAADAFLRLKHAGAPPRDPEWEEAVKQASQDYTNMSDEELERHGAGSHLPGALGGLAGALAGSRRGLQIASTAKTPLRAAGVAGLNALGGMTIGRALGNTLVNPMHAEDIERERQARATANAIGRAPMPEEAAHKQAAERLKLAFLAMTKKADDGEIAGAEMAPPSPPISPDTQKFLTLERMGGEIEEQRASDYYAQRLREKAEELGLLQQQMQEMQAASDATAGELSGMQQAQGVTDQAAQVAKQQSLESAQQAHAAADQAMAQAVQATADATQAKLQLQEMRARLLELAGQDPGIAGLGSPGQVPGAGQAMPGNPQDPNSVPGAGAAPQDPNAQAAQPQDPNAAAQQSGGQAQQPSQSSGGESSQGGSSDSGSSDSSGGGSGTGKVQVKVGSVLGRAGELLSGSRARYLEQGAASLANRAGNQAGVASQMRAAGATVKSRGVSNNGALEALAGKADHQSGRLTSAAHKVNDMAVRESRAVTGTRAGVGAAALAGGAAAASKKEKTAAHPALVGGLIGGAAGMGLAGMEALGHGRDPESQQADIDALEQQSHQPGVKGFGAAFELAKQRALQTLGNATREHPVLSTLAGGAMGAGIGASMGPGVASTLQEAVSNYR